MIKKINESGYTQADIQDDENYISAEFEKARAILKDIEEPYTEEGSLFMADCFKELANFCWKMEKLYKNY